MGRRPVWIRGNVQLCMVSCEVRHFLYVHHAHFWRRRPAAHPEGTPSAVLSHIIARWRNVMVDARSVCKDCHELSDVMHCADKAGCGDLGGTGAPVLVQPQLPVELGV